MSAWAAFIRPILLAAFLFVCLACGDTTAADTVQTSASPSSATPTTPPSASSTPTTVSSPLPVSVQTAVLFVNAPLTASRGSYATLEVKTAAKTSCSIEVDYKSGASTATGLGPKYSDGAGSVSWTWKVGATTTRGSWPITVTCRNGSGQTHINVI
jgi:micrococcal nuclease